jgi:hypothetical protein
VCVCWQKNGEETKTKQRAIVSDIEPPPSLQSRTARRPRLNSAQSPPLRPPRPSCPSRGGRSLSASLVIPREVHTEEVSHRIRTFSVSVKTGSGNRLQSTVYGGGTGYVWCVGFGWNAFVYLDLTAFKSKANIPFKHTHNHHTTLTTRLERTHTTGSRSGSLLLPLFLSLSRPLQN